MSGSYIGQTTTGSLPNITGNFNTNCPTNAGANDAFALHSSYNSQGWDGTANGGRLYIFDASRSSSIYGGSWYSGAKVIPAGTGVNYIIKY